MCDVQTVIQKFSSNGLNLRPDACNFIKKTCCMNKNLTKEEKERWLDHVLRRLTNLDGVDSDVKLPSNIVDLKFLKMAIIEIDEGRGGKEDNKPFTVVDLFKVGWVKDFECVGVGMGVKIKL